MSQQLQARLSHTFKDQRLLTRALTHSSYAHENGCDDNERFEFLGDSVLQLSTTLLLMERFPHAGEGELSQLRARLVNTQTLASIARDLRLGRAVRLGVGEAASGGRARPSILADTVEAVLGALYLDAGYDRCRQLVALWMRPRVEALGESESREHAYKDARSRLQEIVQATWHVTPTYEVVATEGPPHERTFTARVLRGSDVLGEGQGRTKRAAYREAARAALPTVEAAE